MPIAVDIADPGPMVLAQQRNISAWHRARAIRTLSAALRVNIAGVLDDAPVNAYMREWQARNVSLIKTIPSRALPAPQQRMMGVNIGDRHAVHQDRDRRSSAARATTRDASRATRRTRRSASFRTSGRNRLASASTAGARPQTSACASHTWTSAARSSAGTRRRSKAIQVRRYPMSVLCRPEGAARSSPAGAGRARATR